MRRILNGLYFVTGHSGAYVGKILLASSALNVPFDLQLDESAKPSVSTKHKVPSSILGGPSVLI